MPGVARPFRLDLILTRSCPLDCVYCHMERRPGVMSAAVWRAAVDLLLREDGPLELQLMGGEPLVEYGLVREILAYAAAAAARKKKDLSLGVTTNGLLLTADRAAELARLGARVMLSFDGDEDVQTAQRGARSAGKRLWPALERNLTTLAGAGAPFFVNLVVTPESAGRLSKGVAFLLGRGVRALQVSYALGVFWSEERRAALEGELRKAYRLADAAVPPAEVFNRRNDAEPVLLSPQHVVDTDGELYVGTSIVLERLWPALHESFRVGPVVQLERFPGRKVGPKDQLRRLSSAKLDAASRRTMLNNLAVGRRLREFWTSEVLLAPGVAHRTGGR
ncbi:MAG: radical SAM protein [Elusimicrobia bacterium]|nr:radical SAM protein [Elusimicrobiota bacterium]